MPDSLATAHAGIRAGRAGQTRKQRARLALASRPGLPHAGRSRREVAVVRQRRADQFRQHRIVESLPPPRKIPVGRGHGKTGRVFPIRRQHHGRTGLRLESGAGGKPQSQSEPTKRKSGSKTKRSGHERANTNGGGETFRIGKGCKKRRETTKDTKFHERFWFRVLWCFSWFSSNSGEFFRIKKSGGGDPEPRRRTPKH